MFKFLFGLLFSLSLTVSAQTLSPAALRQLKKSEDSMKIYANKMITEKLASDRFISDSVFIRMLVRTLKTPNSFSFPFDSLQTVSRIYAPDSTFRIFSWQFNRDDNYFRQRGAIQVKTSDGSLKLFPLIDFSEFTTSPDDSIRTGKNWIGAIYYGIVMKEFNNKKYYTLLGFDDNNLRSTKKWLDVLTFDEKGNPLFGGPYFMVKDDKVASAKPNARFSMEYKKEGRARMNYDRELDMIVFDHLISEDNNPEKKYTMVPDGDYQGFKWSDGRWLFVDKVFDFKLKDGQAPMPVPLKDATGKSNEEILRTSSEKNRQKEAVQSPAKRNQKRPDPQNIPDKEEY